MGEIVGSRFKSRLTKKVLDRVGTRAHVLFSQALIEMRKGIGPDATLGAGGYGQMWLLSYQAALIEEQVADIKTIKDVQEV